MLVFDNDSVEINITRTTNAIKMTLMCALKVFLSAFNLLAYANMGADRTIKVEQ